MRPSRFFAADPDFAPAFGVFLRQRHDLWRLRRLDRFSPRDTYLADHHVSLQGKIDPAHVKRFLQTEGRKLDIRLPRIEAGDRMTTYIPVTTQPKRLLLDYSMTGEDGRSLEILNRYEDSWLDALHILSKARKGQRKLKESEEFAALLYLATLVFQNPLSLAQRVERWSELEKQQRQHIIFGPGQPLTGEALLSWIGNPGNYFQKGVGTALVDDLRTLVRDHRGSHMLVDWIAASPLRISSADPRGSLPAPKYFESIPSLLLHAIRDFLKLLFDAAPSWKGEKHVMHKSEGQTREELLDDPEGLARHALELLLEGHAVVNELFVQREDWHESDAGVALSNALDTWCAYVQLEVRLGTPFLVKSSEILPLKTPPWRMPEGSVRGAIERRYRSFWRVGHYYPLALKDAQSVHLEVDIPHPELCTPQLRDERSVHFLRLRRWIKTGFADPAVKLGKSVNLDKLGARLPGSVVRWWRRWRSPAIGRFVDLVADLPPEEARRDGGKGGKGYTFAFGVAFGSYQRVSERLLHFYSSRQQHEDPKNDVLNPYLHLYVPLRFKPAIVVGYILSIAAYLIATVFVAGTLLGAMLHHHRPSLLTDTIAVGALAVSLALWLTGVLAREPIVNQKLIAARGALGLCVVVMLAFFAAFLIYLTLHHWSLPGTPATSGALP